MRRKFQILLILAFLQVFSLHARQPALQFFRTFFLKDDLSCLPLTPGRTFLYELAKFVHLNEPEISLYRSLCSSKRVRESFASLSFKQVPSTLQIGPGQELFRCNYLKTRVSFPFRHRDRILMVAREYADMKVRTYLLELSGGKFRKVKELKYLFLSSTGSRFFTVKGKSRRVIFLNENLQPEEKLAFREGFVKEIFVKGSRVYIHRKRFCSGEAAVDLYIKGRLVRSFFHLHQSLSALPLEVGVADDTVMAAGKRRVYLSFSYPQEGVIRIYTFSPEGKPQQIWEIEKFPGYRLAPGFVEENKILESLREEDLLAVNTMWESGEKLYLVVSLCSPRTGKFKSYLYIIDPESITYQRVKLDGKMPVFYDAEKGELYSVVMEGRVLKILKFRINRR